MSDSQQYSSNTFIMYILVLLAQNLFFNCGSSVKVNKGVMLNKPLRKYFKIKKRQFLSHCYLDQGLKVIVVNYTYHSVSRRVFLVTSWSLIVFFFNFQFINIITLGRHGSVGFEPEEELISKGRYWGGYSVPTISTNQRRVLCTTIPININFDKIQRKPGNCGIGKRLLNFKWLLMI